MMEVRLLNTLGSSKVRFTIASNYEGKCTRKPSLSREFQVQHAAHGLCTRRVPLPLHMECIPANVFNPCFPLFQSLSLLSPSCPVCPLLPFPFHQVCCRSSALFVLRLSLLVPSPLSLCILH